MRDASSHSKDRNHGSRAILALVAVVAIFAFALFLRAYWNVDAAATGDGFVLSAGSDPYYHKRAVDFIQANGWETLSFDPLLNYPYGAFNPNPPLFQWSVAVGGAILSPFFGGDLDTATWWAMLWSPAIWGALTIVPTYLIGRDVFNRRTGIVAAFLLAVSTSHIDHTALGAADHDAMLLFFAVFAFWAYVRAIQSFRGDGSWVANWRDGASVSAGLKRFAAERRGGLGWSLLTGVFIGAVGLIWKGFPYLIGVMIAYVALQLLVDHWRSKDSLGIWLGTLIAFVVGTLMLVPAYSTANVLGFLKPVWFLIAAHFVFGLVMVPTRDLPTILVIPAFVLIGVLGALVAFFVVPEVAQSLLYATVYFKQTSIYQTIAEAHPADFNTMVFGIGPVAFFLALGGLVYLAFTAGRHPTRASLFMVVWAVIAIYMAHSAVRFLFNATPVLAILAAWAVVLVLDWLKFGSIGRSMQGASSFTAGLRRAMNGWQISAVLFIALLLVVPSIVLAVDAAIPSSEEQRIGEKNDFMKGFVDKRFGAFGQGFLPDYWRNGLTNLSQIDDYGPSSRELSNRPAFVSWWDYGHWAIEVGQHPAVADNFQNGYEYAANLLLAQNETHATQLLSARSFGLIGEERSVGLIEQAGVPANESEAVYEALVRWEFSPALDLEKAVRLEGLVTEATKGVDVHGRNPYPDGVRIRYFAADFRMLPYDVSQTSYVDYSGIFYAPVVLKGDEVSDYVQLVITAGNEREGVREFTEEEFENRVRDVTRSPVQAQSQAYRYKQPFFDSMFYRAFVGTPIDAQNGVPGDQLDRALQFPQPAVGMKHWRLSIGNDQLRIIEYYPGAVLTGSVLEDGTPKPGVTVTAYDDAGRLLHPLLTEFGQAQLKPEDLNVPHDSVTTDANGTYELVLPFNLEGGEVTVVVESGGVELSNSTFQVSRADANAKRAFTHDFRIQSGSVSGTAFFDADDDGAYNATNGDQIVPDLRLAIGGRNATTDAEGEYALPEVSAGARSVTVNSTEYVVSPFTSSARVQPNRENTHDVALRLRPVAVDGTVSLDTDGDGTADESVGGVRITFAADGGSTGRNVTASAIEGGTYSQAVTPGSYTVTANFTDDEGVLYEFEETLVVPRATEQTEMTFDVVLRRSG